MQSFFIENESTGQLARHDCAGEHDGKFTSDAREAAMFDTWGDASDFLQNFGPHWNVVGY